VSRLELVDLHVWFDVPGGELHAVRGVSATLESGRRLGLVGESGSGKTTAILAILGLLPSSATVAGKVLLDGEDLLAGGERRLRRTRWTDIAMVFQGAMNSLNPVKSVGWQIVEPMEAHGTDHGRRARGRALELLELVGLSADVATRFPHELSGGMRQRVTLAMALACRPRVLLADEPTTALDVMVQAQVLSLLIGLTAKLELALLLVSHDLPVVAQSCDEMAVMYAGQIVESGSVTEMVEHPRHPYTRMLFAASPDLADRGPVRSIVGTPPRLDRLLRGCPFQPRCDVADSACATRAPDLVSDADGHRTACHNAGAQPATVRGLASAGRGRRAHGSDLLTVSRLACRFPVRRGLVAAALRRPRRWVRAVDGVSLRVAAGELLALVGESGSGKTSVAQAILGGISPVAGSVRFDGVDLVAARRRDQRQTRRRIQAVFQDPYESLDPRWRVRSLVEEPLRIHRPDIGRAERRRRVGEALTRVGLDPPELYVDRHPHELSGGQRQRVAIAAALMLDPEILVADEPVSMLDVSARAGVLDVFSHLRQDARMGILMITHDLSTAAHYADRIAVMYLGRIVEQGPARAVIDHPQHPYTAALVSVVPRHGSLSGTPPQVLAGEVPDPSAIPSGCRFRTRCPRVVAVCANDEPQLLPTGSPDRPEHSAACLLVATTVS